EPVPHLGIPQHLARARVEKLTFPGPAYEGFDKSQDVLGDGSIVAVPTPGHTSGATSYFVNSGDGHRWFFVGDAAWVKEGFAAPARDRQRPVPRPRLRRRGSRERERGPRRLHPHGKRPRRRADQGGRGGRGELSRPRPPPCDGPRLARRERLRGRASGDRGPR